MSNAEGRSSSVNKDTCPLSRPKKISFVAFRSSLYYGQTGMWIEKCSEDSYDLNILQAAGEQLSPKLSRRKINLTQVYNFKICLYQKNFLEKVQQ